MTMRIGAVLPILATATGLAFASFLPRHFTEPLITAERDAAGSLNLFTRDLAAIDRLMTQVRGQGYAYNDAGRERGSISRSTAPPPSSRLWRLWAGRSGSTRAKAQK
jgi:DNA-binding IclR family transcriptional regulator